MIRKPLHFVIKYAASSYIAGPDIHDAIRIYRRIDKKGLKSIICPWDGPHDSPEVVTETYKAALNYLREDRNIDCYLSIKVPSIKYDLDVITGLINIAQKGQLRIHFDSLAPETASLSMALLEKAVEIYPNIGYTLPAIWNRSIDDAKRIINLGIPVRVVKGQWSDPDVLNTDYRSNFIEIIDILAGRSSCVGVATHDTSLAERALLRLKRAGACCELEQLYGLPPCIDDVAKPLDIPSRIYIPYGYAYLSYALSGIRKRPVIFAWLLRDFLRGIKRKHLVEVEAEL